MQYNLVSQGEAAMKHFIYEVTVVVPESEESALFEYMRKKHVQDVIEHKAFSHAEFFRVTDVAPGKYSLTVHYHVRDEDGFRDYQGGPRKEMSDDFTQHFGHCEPEVIRRVLSLPEMIHRR